MSTRYASLPPLPERIKRLDELAVDLWWAWHPAARTVFRRLDYGFWRSTADNPGRVLLNPWRGTPDQTDGAQPVNATYHPAKPALDHAPAPRPSWWLDEL